MDQSEPTSPSDSTSALAPQCVYRHPDWVVLYKPEGYSVQALAAQYAPHFPAFHPVHRLDKETSGLWLIALTSEANKRLSPMFAEKTVQKHYLAVLEQKKLKKKQGWVKGDMSPSRRKAWRLLKTMDNPAITQFFTQHLAHPDKAGLRLAYLLPKTGKTHQLRVAMKANGSGIVGDDIYAALPAERLHLHAYRLQFQDLGERFDISALPKSGVYFQGEAFSEAFSALVQKLPS